MLGRGFGSAMAMPSSCRSPRPVNRGKPRVIASHGGTENTGRERIQGAGSAFARTSGATAGRSLTRARDAEIVMAAGGGRDDAGSSLRGHVRAFWLVVRPLRPFVRTLRRFVRSFSRPVHSLRAFVLSFWRFVQPLRRVLPTFKPIVRSF